MSHLLIPNIEVQAANALACPWIINAAPIMAATMFAHRLVRMMPDCSGERVAIAHHDAQFLGERPGRDGFYQFAPQQRRGATFIDAKDYSSTNKQALSIQPTASFHWRVSLFLEFRGAPDIEAAKRHLRRAKLAGGEIVRHGDLVTESSAEDLRAAVNGPAYWLIERRDLMQRDADPLQAMFAALDAQSEPPSASDASTEASANSTRPTSWLTPAVLGYAALTDFGPRGGVRLTDDHGSPPHAFCEPLVGLAQYVSLKQYGERPVPYWRHCWPRHDTFVVEQVHPFQ